jgi:hypothetical protein
MPEKEERIVSIVVTNHQGEKLRIRYGVGTLVSVDFATGYVASGWETDVVKPFPQADLPRFIRELGPLASIERV